jgi:rod shape-determining protein MreC
MVADVRLRITQPVRAAMAQVLYPAQWLILQPVAAARDVGGYFQSLQVGPARGSRRCARSSACSPRRPTRSSSCCWRTAGCASWWSCASAWANGKLAQVLYDAADPFSRKIIIDKGQVDGIAPGSPVIDEAGVLGQVTRVYGASARPRC